MGCRMGRRGLAWAGRTEEGKRWPERPEGGWREMGGDGGFQQKSDSLMHGCRGSPGCR